MRHVHNLLSVLMGATLLQAGCAGGPEPQPSAPGATTPTQTRPQAAPATQSRPQQAEPPATDEGMTVFELQERLNQLGYKLGTVDGVMGPRTLEALKKFQSDNNLSASGTLDLQTIRKLRTAKY